jgi:hypothetical protein
MPSTLSSALLVAVLAPNFLSTMGYAIPATSLDFGSFVQFHKKILIRSVSEGGPALASLTPRTGKTRLINDRRQYTERRRELVIGHLEKVSNNAF